MLIPTGLTLPGLLGRGFGFHRGAGPALYSGLLLWGDQADDATDFLLLWGDQADDAEDFILLWGDQS